MLENLLPLQLLDGVEESDNHEFGFIHWSLVWDLAVLCVEGWLARRLHASCY